mgnify:CR=1 FL=1
MAETAFDTARYREQQVAAFSARIPFDSPTVIEFGGKPFGDYHATRVLPGYDPDVKAGIIRSVHSELSSRSLGGAVITMAVHAKDLLAHPDGRRPNARIRGDYGVTYDVEVFRMAEEARNRFGIDIANVAITATPRVLSKTGDDFIRSYSEKLGEEFDKVVILPEIAGYPYLPPENVIGELTSAEAIAKPYQSELVVSPGGGSGKFSVAVTEIAHKLKAGVSPQYIKFETFPVFHLPTTHPLNKAFIAATADLANELVELDNGETNYDKDIGNFALLQNLLAAFPDVQTPMRSFGRPTDMGVNVIESGIVDAEAIRAACDQEIVRRTRRYLAEIIGGNESQIALDNIQRLTAS